MLQKCLDSANTPKEVCEILQKHCVRVTEQGRVFMEQNPDTRLPTNYELYPGTQIESITF